MKDMEYLNLIHSLRVIESLHARNINNSIGKFIQIKIDELFRRMMNKTTKGLDDEISKATEWGEKELIKSKKMDEIAAEIKEYKERFDTIVKYANQELNGPSGLEFISNWEKENPRPQYPEL